MDKLQVFQRIKMGLFAPSEPIPNAKTTSHDWQPYLDCMEVAIKHDEMCAGWWESEFEKPFCDNDQDGRSQPDPLEVIVESHITDAGTCSTPGTLQETCSRTIRKQDGIYDRTQTDHCRSPKLETSSKQSLL